MEQKQGLKDFALIIEPIMEKCRDDVRITMQEQNTVFQFYLEVVIYLAQPDSRTTETGMEESNQWEI